MKKKDGQHKNVAQRLRDVGSWMKPLGNADAVCILSGGCLNHDHLGQKISSIIEFSIPDTNHQHNHSPQVGVKIKVLIYLYVSVIKDVVLMVP